MNTMHSVRDRGAEKRVDLSAFFQDFVSVGNGLPRVRDGLLPTLVPDSDCHVLLLL